MAGVVRPTASMAIKPLATFSAASRQLVQQRAFASVPRNALNAARTQRKTIAQQCRRGYAEQTTVSLLRDGLALGARSVERVARH